jgi:effector-binding domain-containing protein
MRILKIVGLLILALLLIVAVLGFLLPKEYALTREVIIEAPQNLVFQRVGSLRAMDTWSPWSKMDPDIQVTWDGEDGAVGSSMSWIGNKNVGQGSNTITASDPPYRVETELRFIEPFESAANTWIELQPVDGGTKVIWGMSGKSPFPLNVLTKLLGMEKSIAKDYDEGLASLNALVEDQAMNPVYRGYAIRTEDFAERIYVGYRAKLPFNEMPAYFQKNMPGIYRAALAAGAAMAGTPAGLYYEWDMETQMADMATAIPVATPVTIKGASIETIPAGRALVVDYYGPYEGTGEAHFALDDYLKDFGVKVGIPVIEEYVTDPATEPDTAKWLTRIIYRLE